MKLKERLVIGVMAGLVLLTVVLVLDVETGLTSGDRPRTPAHARVRYAFRQRHLQKTNNGSREASLAAAASAQLSAAVDDPAHPPPPGPDNLVAVGATGGRQEPKTTSTTPPDPYNDLVEAVVKVDSVSKLSRRRRKHWNPTLGELLGIDLSERPMRAHPDPSGPPREPLSYEAVDHFPPDARDIGRPR
nr:extracellular serine/threonine protein CG31145-like [Penaeus vannamei]